MNDLVTVTIASTGRKERLSDCIRSIDYDNVRVRVGVREGADIPTDIQMTFSALFTNDFPVAVQNDLASSIEERSHVLAIADDIIFEPGAIQEAVDTLNDAFPDGDGIIGLNITNMRNDQKCPYAFMLVGSKFFNERLARVLFFPGYRHFFADMELGEYAESLGRFRFCSEARVIHFHPSTGAPADRTHTEGRQGKWEHDNELYLERKTRIR